MRNVRVMNIPVGVLAAWILVLGYALWAMEAVVVSPAQKRSACSTSVVQMSTPVSTQGARPNNS